MSKKFLTLMLALVLLVGLTVVPVVSHAVFTMYVYTEDGKSLNVRSSPNTGDNRISGLPYGTEVYVDYHLGNGWTALMWTGAEYDHVYVQTRFLVYDKPARKPSGGGSGSGSSSTPGDSSTTVTELNKIFKTYRAVANPYRITVRPVRASGWVNLRFAPTKMAEVLATYKANDQVLVIAEFNGWYQVEDPVTGAVGYMSTAFVIK